MAIVQSWYFNRAGRTFQWTPTIVIESPFPISHYKDPSGKNEIYYPWNVILKELNSLLPNGLPSLGTQSRIYVLVLEGLQFDDHFGAATYFPDGEEGGGIALLESRILSYIADELQYSIWENAGHRSLAHELGHTFRLLHIDPYKDETSIMGYNNRFLTAEITKEDLKILLASPYLK
jgi:hypothetical protein